MDKKLKSALKNSFTPPAPQRREIFIKSLNYPKVRPIEVFFVQAAYISKLFWIGSFTLLFVVLIFIHNANISPQDIGYISAVLPLLSLFSITEIYKSISYNMAELELSCKYNLEKVILMRMMIVGTVSTIILFTIIILSRNIGFGIYRNALYLTVPFLLSNYLSLVVINRFKLKETMYVCASTSILIAAFQVMVVSFKIYLQLYMDFVWLATFFIVSLLLCIEIIKLKKQMEEFTWSLS